MKPFNNMALKEWAIVVKALDEGKQVVLFRKGGVREEQGEFVVEHNEFFLYPTYEHQMKSLLRPQFHEDYFKVSEAEPKDRTLPLQNYAFVETIIQPKDIEKLYDLQDEYIWNSTYVKNRINYKKQWPLHVLLLRVFRLPEQTTIKVTEHYDGCKSWVDLDIELATEGCQPVLKDEEFFEMVERIKRFLL
ncbi:MAG: DUF1802 family protein [Candidatus Tectomicrobia bacterium]|nr:DUF1802 family protein [Candidatus Tectomicrobia bacterium]